MIWAYTFLILLLSTLVVARDLYKILDSKAHAPHLQKRPDPSQSTSQLQTRISDMRTKNWAANTTRTKTKIPKRQTNLWILLTVSYQASPNIPAKLRQEPAAYEVLSDSEVRNTVNCINPLLNPILETPNLWQTWRGENHHSSFYAAFVDIIL